MRIGFNPHKDQQQGQSECLHQIIIPVYIPNQEGYFKDSFQILQLCLNSLFKTIHNKTYITIVNNGSGEFVKEYLDELLKSGKIQELIHTQNIGKLNAILKGIVGNSFSLITITDADVLFLKNWQEATYTVFENFPKAGAVCPTPSSRSLRTHTANIYWDLFFSSRLIFSNVINRDALRMFAQSVGDINFYNEVQLEKYLTISNKNIKAVVGAGHFVTTFRGEIFNTIENRHTKYKLGGDSESKFLDISVVKKGFWRLSTANNYAYHLGNVFEDWMQIECDKLEVNRVESNFELKDTKSSSFFLNFIKNKLFGKFILNKKIMKYYLIWKGMSKKQAKVYLK
jgi:hypothetical protein